MIPDIHAVQVSVDSLDDYAALPNVFHVLLVWLEHEGPDVKPRQGFVG